MAKRFLRRIYRGCGYLPGYGHHPGNVPLLMLAVLGAAAGGIAGAGLMLVVFGFVYLVGAYERGRDAEPEGEGNG